MNILIGCECSQVVTKAFREKGHNAFSCDIVDCYGEHPEWHIKGDLLNLLSDNVSFFTCSNDFHSIKHWDLIIAHPPCTYLSKAGSNRLIKIVDGVRIVNKERFEKMRQAAKFFYDIIERTPTTTKLCIENPIPLKMAGLPCPSQSIQPYYFGDKSVKYTYLWLYNGLNPLLTFSTTRPAGCVPIVNASTRYPGRFNSSKLRSETPQGFALAMVEQWG